MNQSVNTEDRKLTTQIKDQPTCMAEAERPQLLVTSKFDSEGP